MLTYLSGVVRPELLALRPDLGVMLQPRAGNRPDLTSTPWALDNGLFHEVSTPERTFDDTKFWKLLTQNVPYMDTCQFVVCPDVPYEDVNTLTFSMLWWPALRQTGYPLALAAQNGIERWRIPWECFDVLFLGGTTEWKLGAEAAKLARLAKRRGLRVHMGRVNSLKRMVWAKAIGCDSADGTYLAFAPDRNLPSVLSWIDAVNTPVAA